LSCEKVGNVTVNDGNVKLSEDRMSENPGVGEFVLEACVETSEGREGGSQGRLTMGNGTGPVSESDPSHHREEREMMVEVTEEPADGGTVIETGHRREVKAMKMKRGGKEGGVEVEGETKVFMNLMCDGSVKRLCIGLQQRLECKPGAKARDQALCNKAAQEGER